MMLFRRGLSAGESATDSAGTYVVAKMLSRSDSSAGLTLVVHNWLSAFGGVVLDLPVFARRWGVTSAALLVFWEDCCVRETVGGASFAGARLGLTVAAAEVLLFGAED